MIMQSMLRKLSIHLLLVVAIISIGASTTAPSTAPATAPSTQPDDPVGLILARDILDDVTVLASDDFNGRFARSKDGQRAAEWIARQFQDAGLEAIKPRNRKRPTFLHSLNRAKFSPNVVGARRGKSDDRFIIICAHYDHLPPARPGESTSRAGDRIYNGADDNASGVAAMLAIARATRDIELDATLIFIAFSGEEEGLIGSKSFTSNSPIPLKRVVALFNMDMVSRGSPKLIYVEGGKNADPLREALNQSNEVHHLEMEIKFDEHPDWLFRSDQLPFMQRSVPVVLLSVADHPDYHQVTDEADRIFPELAEGVSRLVLGAVIEMAR